MFHSETPALYAISNYITFVNSLFLIKIRTFAWNG